MTHLDVAGLILQANRIRGDLLEMSHRARAAHLGSALSSVDILVALYWSWLKIIPSDPKSENRDRFILSKGHGASALYAVLAHKGFFPLVQLKTYGQFGSSLEEHPGPGIVAGVEAATGSLGHGLSIGIGQALAGRIKGRNYRVGILMSDGECNEGSVWESAMFAPAHQIDNLFIFIDFNKWQATGRSREVMALEPLAEKWQSFGWNVREVDGHDMTALLALLREMPAGTGKPTAVVAHTVKGKGISFMEDDNNWHYRVPNELEILQAKQELGLQ